MLTRLEVHDYMRKFYRFLESEPVIAFKKMRGYRGFIWGTEPNSKRLLEVHLDPRDSVVSTLIHEFLHYQHPKWSETRILTRERELMNALSDLQVRNIIKRFASVL